MGHIRLGNLPRTRKWQQVVSLIGEGADVRIIASAALDASQTGLALASKDPALVHSFWLLTQLPLCARSENYVESLNGLGISVSNAPGVLELVGAFTDSVDSHVLRIRGRTDLGEMAQMGAAESLAALVGQRSQSLFGTTGEDVRFALRSLGTSRQFSVLTRDFFARLTERYLSYFLSRELSNHVGLRRRFSNIAAHDSFNKGLAIHCRQASKIVEEFAGGWFSKTNFEGRITPAKAAGFVHVALNKIGAELKKGAEVDER